MKNKLFLCFRPVAVKIETASIGPDSFDDQISSTPANSRSPKTCFLKKSPVSSVERSRFSESEIPKKQKKKKARDKKDVKIVEDSRISNSRKSDALFSDAPKSSPPTLSISSTNSLPTPKTPYEENKDFPTEPSTPLIQKKHVIHHGHRRKKSTETRVINGLRNSYEGVVLILINLVITVFYGRLCAVVFTCLFFYSICRLRNSERLEKVAPEKVAAAVETVERDYRKRVIMEGLLQRNNHYLQQQRRGH